MNTLKNLPFTLLRAFEAAGRTGSFGGAAKELNLSPSAISHAIRKLEEILKIKLFQRNTRDIQLTREGTLLLEYIERGFDEFRRGFDMISGDEFSLLRIHSAPSFATQWLLPRLANFIKTYPQIDIRLSADTDYSRFDSNDFDLDIVYGKPILSGVEIIPLAVEELTPLCSPTLAKNIKSPKDLYDQTLIQCDLQFYQWKGWFEANELQPPIKYGLRFDRSFMALAAAVDGLGVVLESKLLAEKELKNGTLVCPLISNTKEIHYIGHYLVYSTATTHRRAINIFREWLLNNLGIGRKVS